MVLKRQKYCLIKVPTVAFDNDTTILELGDKARLPIGPKEWIVPKDICRDK